MVLLAILALTIVCMRARSVEISETTIGQNASNKCMVFAGSACLSREEDLLKIPSNPITINVDIQLVQITEVDNIHNTITLTAWIGCIWQDHRLTSTQDGLYQLLDKKWRDAIWYPEMWIWGLADFKVFKTRKNDEGENCLK